MFTLGLFTWRWDRGGGGGASMFYMFMFMNFSTAEEMFKCKEKLAERFCLI